MQGIDVQLAEQMAAGDQRHGKQQQGHAQADRLAVFAQPFEPAQAMLGIGQCGSNRSLCFGRLGAHQPPRGLRAAGRLYPVKVPIPLEA
ncbi:hypothetical protein D3C76_1635660 [compost metagenome]